MLQTSILGIGYAYNSSLSYVDHLRIADSAFRAATVISDAVACGTQHNESAIRDAAWQVGQALLTNRPQYV